MAAKVDDCADPLDSVGSCSDDGLPQLHGAEAGSSREETEHRVPARGRSGVRRVGLLRPAEDPHAEPGSDGGRRDAVHAVLSRSAGVCPVAVRADDGQAPGACVHSRQPAGQAGGRRPGADSGRDGDAGRNAEGRRIRDGGDGQMGTRPARQLGRSEQAGIRPVLRLQLPGSRAQLLSRRTCGGTTST